MEKYNDNQELIETNGQENEPEKKEANEPLFSDEVFDDDLELGESDLDKLPI